TSPATPQAPEVARAAMHKFGVARPREIQPVRHHRAPAGVWRLAVGGDATAGPCPRRAVDRRVRVQRFENGWARPALRVLPSWRIRICLNASILVPEYRTPVS